MFNRHILSHWLRCILSWNAYPVVLLLSLKTPTTVKYKFYLKNTSNTFTLTSVIAWCRLCCAFSIHDFIINRNNIFSIYFWLKIIFRQHFDMSFRGTRSRCHRDAAWTETSRCDTKTNKCIPIILLTLLSGRLYISTCLTLWSIPYSWAT